MNKKQIFIGLIIVAVLGAFMIRPSVSAETAVNQTANSAVQTSNNVVSVEGRIIPLRDATLSFMVGGRVAEIIADEGTAVAAGDPILTLETADLQLGVQQAEAGVTTAEAALTAAQAQLALAQARLTTAEIGVRAANAQLDLTKAGARPEEIAAAEQRVAAANSSITQAAGNRDAALYISEAQISSAEANVASEAANLRAIQEGYDDIINACFDTPDGQTICPLYGTVEETTRAQLEIAQLQLSAAQEALDALNAGPTGAQQRAASGGVAIAIANRDLAQAQLDLLLAGATDEQIRQSEVGVEQAQLGVEQAGTAVTQAEAAITQAEAGVVQAKAQLAAAQNKLDRMTLTAPFDGTVVSIMVDEGEIASTGVPVVIFADMSSWLMETTDLTELSVADLDIGDTAVIQLDAIDNEEISGTITEIAAVSTLTRGDVTYAVTVDLAPNSLPLRWGMTTFMDVE